MSPWVGRLESMPGGNKMGSWSWWLKPWLDEAKVRVCRLDRARHPSRKPVGRHIEPCRSKRSLKSMPTERYKIEEIAQEASPPSRILCERCLFDALLSVWWLRVWNKAAGIGADKYSVILIYTLRSAIDSGDSIGMSRWWKLSRNKLIQNACHEETQNYNFDVITVMSFETSPPGHPPC